jgi:CheY-like chemotaxis protein
LGEAIRASDGRLVLLVDYDVDSRRQARHLLELRGMEVVQASNGMAALELIQRLPRSFRLVLTDLDLPGIPGAVVVETLRLIRPDLPVLCMSATRTVAGRVEVKRCLSKPLQGGELEAMLEESASGWELEGLLGVSDELAARVRARFAVAGDLVEAALELYRGADLGE